YRSLSVSSFIRVKLILLGFARNLCLMKRARSQNLYVQPRSRKIRSKIGIGMPRSQSKMYPVAPACLILFVKRISDILRYRFGTFRYPRELALIAGTHNRHNE